MKPVAPTIAFVCQPYHRGGVTRWMADAALAFGKRGFAVYFVTVIPGKPFYSGRNSETIVSVLNQNPNNVNIATASVGRSFEFGLPEFVADQYINLIRNSVPVGTPIILSDDASVWRAGIAVKSAHPIIGVLHGDDPYYYNLAARYGDQVDGYACVSGRVSRKLAEHVPTIAHSKIHTIPCGIVLAPVVERHKTEGALSIIFVGRIAQYPKRIFDFVEIALKLRETEKQFHITIVGDGLNDRTELEQRIAKNGLTEQFTFTGWLQKDQVEAQLQCHDMLVLTSEFEGTSVSMMEALAAGCGFVGSRVSGAEDYEHHENAQNCFRIFEIGDIDQAVAGILSLAEIDPKVRGKSARNLAESQFSLDVCLDRYTSLISQLPERQYVRTNYSLPFRVKIMSLIKSSLRRVKMKMGAG